MLKNKNIDVLVGNTIVEYDDNYSKIQDGKIKDFRFDLPFCHPSSFARASVIKRVKFDLSKVYSDLVTYYKLLDNGARYKYVDKCISKFDYNGLSSQFKIKSEFEKFRFGKKHFNLYPLQFTFYLINKLIKAFLKKVLPYKIVRKIQVSK